MSSFIYLFVNFLQKITILQEKVYFVGACPSDFELITMHEMVYKVGIFGLAIYFFGFFFSVSSDSGRL